jgi:hypothetical protein
MGFETRGLLCIDEEFAAAYDEAERENSHWVLAVKLISEWYITRDSGIETKAHSNGIEALQQLSYRVTYRFA